ncbi:hypothetical protein PRIPAC_79384 [Pristionchus pacificus]|uniref:Uncharacterized protein n=1 Tax=Pristionchus pacificus TaxID=54126 RepID=A0A2A6CKP7_PRIPA|nr:hypothetical protein PRIPAC_79384 [Pristionchus pacificus]|eukprot:PDM78601.1 hypothetical protein PRIPAC_31180 [Pristionchus pacificus]
MSTLLPASHLTAIFRSMKDLITSLLIAVLLLFYVAFTVLVEPIKIKSPRPVQRRIYILPFLDTAPAA